MPHSRGRRAAIAACATAVLAIGAMMTIHREALLEVWLLWRLESRDDATRLAAAERLGAMKSLRAAPRLMRWIEEDGREALILRDAEVFPDGMGRAAISPLAFALFQIGPAAREAFPSWYRPDTDATRDASRQRVGQLLDAVVAVWAGGCHAERWTYDMYQVPSTDVAIPPGLVR